MSWNIVNGFVSDSEDAISVIQRKDILLSCISGLMLTLCQPPFDISVLSWIAVVPLFVSSVRLKSLKQSFIIGCVSGFVHFMTLLYWLTVAMKQYGNMPMLLSAMVLILVCTILSLYIGIVASVASYVGLKDVKSIFVISGIWIGLEFIRGYIPYLGFPWCLLGYSQHDITVIAQLSAVTGVYGISYLILLINCCIAHLFIVRSKYGLTTLYIFIISILIAASAIVTGVWRSSLSAEKYDSASLRVSIIQPSIDQSIKWDRNYQSKTMKLYEDLTRFCFPFKPDIIVWPETAVPFFLQEQKSYVAQIQDMAFESNSSIILGSPAYNEEKNRINTEYYNRAYYITGNSGILDYHDKVHLVPFGEYVPLADKLPFLNKFIPMAGSFVSGEKLIPLKGDPSVSPGVLICFEAIFPDLARSYAKNDADLLVNITNDAWFGRTGAPYQHLAMTKFRSIETGLPIVRAANTGISALILPSGKIVEQSGLFEKIVLNGELPVGNKIQTPYVNMGDWFLIIAAGTAAFLLLMMRYKKRIVS